MTNSKRNSGPCLGCTERRVGCHGKCGQYRAWTAKNDEERKERQEASEKDREVGRYIRDYKERRRRSQHRKGPR